MLHTGPGDADEAAISVEAGSLRVEPGPRPPRLGRGPDPPPHQHQQGRHRRVPRQHRPIHDPRHYAGRTVTDNGTFNLRIGGMASAFGAQDFYTANFPQQFEQVGLWRGQLTWQHELRGWDMEAGVHHRNHSDRFELATQGKLHYVEDADGILTSDNGPVPGWYQGASSTCPRIRRPRWRPSGHRLGGNLDLRRLPPEGVVSNRLMSRTSAGATASALGDRRTNLDLGIGQRRTRTPHRRPRRVERELRRGWPPPTSRRPPCLYASTRPAVPWPLPPARRSVRMPSYTDLYYTVGGAQGSQDLLPEEAEHLEFGYRLTGDH